MAGRTSLDNTGAGSSTRYANNDSQDSSNDKTLKLVEELKYLLKNRLKKNSLIKEEDVESYTAEAKSNLYPTEYDITRWQKQLSFHVDNSSRDLIVVSMAYAKTPEQIEPIFQRKKEQRTRNTNTQQIEEPTETSLQNIIAPLNQLKQEKPPKGAPNLFNAVLSFSDDQIDRADRMFYSEAFRLLGNRSDYTFDHAHDQVQAIRLMHYESDDSDQLFRFIQGYRHFDEAYSHLQNLTRDRAIENSRSGRPSSSNKGGKSIIGSTYGGDTSTSNNQPPSLSSPYNYPSNNSSSNRPSSSTNRSSNNTGGGSNNYGGNTYPDTSRK